MEFVGPLDERERIKVIDSIRGFAILGIFLVNMLDFSSPWMYMDVDTLWKEPINISTNIFIDIFAQANFYTLFSMLFGFGMVIFMERMEKKNLDFTPFYVRRLLVLLVIGTIHAFLIWHGDILITYALVGFLLIPFRKASNNVILGWIGALLLLPTLVLSSYIFSLEEKYGDLVRVNTEKIEQSLEVYGSGSYSDITIHRINEWINTNIGAGEGLFFIIVVLLPMFLMGVYIAKNRWFHDIHEHRVTLKKVWALSLLFAVFFKLLPYIFDSLALAQIQDMVGGPATALLYATSIALLMKYRIWQRILVVFSYVGRLSLSNYLLQSIIGTLIFYSYGLGFYGEVSPFYASLLVLIIYMMQILLSKLWLMKFTIGPAEWVWRSLTYKKVQPIRRNIRREGRV